MQFKHSAQVKMSRVNGQDAPWVVRILGLRAVA